MNIKLGNKKYNVQVFESDEEKEQGLSNVITMNNDEGGLFIYDEPCDVIYTMEDTEIPLDIIFINEDFEVISIKKGVPLSKEDYSESNIQYVIELNQNSDVKIGDELELDEEEELDEKMFIIDSDGNSQMTLDGGERVFSIKDTKILISLSKKAYKSKNIKDYQILGKKLFKFMKIQDSNKPEYIKLKKD